MTAFHRLAGDDRAYPPDVTNVGKLWLGALVVVLVPLLALGLTFLTMLGTWQQDLGVLGEAVAVLCLTWLAVWLYQRHVAARQRGLGGTADALANFIDVFHPEQARSQRALREVHSRTIAPVPDDEDDPVQLVTNRDGTPRAVRIHRHA